MKSSKKHGARRDKVAPGNPGEAMRSWLLAGLTALCVARPLLPSEGVSWLGDGQPFALLWLILCSSYLLLALTRGGLEQPLDLVDGAMALLVLACCLSALV